LARKAENAKISKLAKKKKTKRYNNDNDRTSPAFRSFGESCSLSLSLSLSKQDADIERGGCVRELDD